MLATVLMVVAASAHYLGSNPAAQSGALVRSCTVRLYRSAIPLCWDVYGADLVGGSARQRFLVTFWRFRGDTHTACVATKPPTGATGKTRRPHQRSTCPYRNAATLRICLLAKLNDHLELYWAVLNWSMHSWERDAHGEIGGVKGHRRSHDSALHPEKISR